MVAFSYDQIRRMACDSARFPGLGTAPVAGDAFSGMGLLLDCDGTLLDSIDAWYLAEEHVASSVDITITDEARDEINALTLDEAAAYFHDHYDIGDNADEVKADIDAFMLQYYRTRANEMPGALGFVKRMHEQGARQIVVSSSPSVFLEAGLAHAGFLPYLDGVISANDVGIPKREARMWDAACRMAGTDKAATWAFDDSLYALDAARAAGYRVVGTYSHDMCSTHDELREHADIAVENLGELDPERLRAQR